MLYLLSSIPKTFSLRINVQVCERRILVKDAHFQRGQLIVVKVPVAQGEGGVSQKAAPHEYAKCPLALPALPGSHGEMARLKLRQSSAACNFTGRRVSSTHAEPCCSRFPTALILTLSFPSFIPETFLLRINVQPIERRILVKGAHLQRGQLIVVKVPVAKVREEQQSGRRQKAAPARVCMPSVSLALPALPGSRGEMARLKLRQSSAACNFTGRLTR